MIGKIYAVIVIISFISGAFGGKMDEVGDAAINGAVEAVKFAIELSGVMCFWCGIMKILEKAGAIRILSKLISPILRFLFPESYKSGKGIHEIAVNISANFLGLGNAATPMGLMAMEKLKDNCRDGRASDDMVMLTVLNTASIQIIPTTLIALRTIAQSANPYEVILPIWICSTLTVCFAVAVTKIWNGAKRRKKKC